MFQDEARFGRINKPRKCWAPKGVRPIVKSQIIRQYTYSYGAFSPKDGDCTLLILPSMTNKAMEAFLEELSIRHKDEFILLVCDKAPNHRKTGVKVPENILLFHLPPYSPELNPPEHIWDDMREKFFGNKAFNSMDAVEDKLVEASLFYENNPEIVKSIAGFDWIINTL
jgi:transposase